jgi:hypothetical protein
MEKITGARMPTVCPQDMQVQRGSGASMPGEKPHTTKLKNEEENP